MFTTKALPNPHSTAWDWQLKARCRGMPSEVFYSPDYERGTARTLREARAKQICRSCPVQEACRSYAVSTGEPHGIWGATTPRERNVP